MLFRLLPMYRNLLLFLLVCFILALAGLMAFYSAKTNEYAIQEAKRQALHTLLAHRATHAYVTQIQRPEIYRLKEEGKLYQGYFSPQVMSFTFISRNMKGLLNMERKKFNLEPIYFKLASENPRNPINTADALEKDLLRRMNAIGLQEHEEVLHTNGRKFLYLAVPIERSNQSCMKCHGDPKDAPAELIAMYGDKAGFHEQANTIRALISIRVPLEGILAEARGVANTLGIVTFLVMAAIYLLITLFIARINTQQMRIEQQNTELSRLSVTDALTNINNRLGLTRRLAEATSLAKRHIQPLALLMLDLDHFKPVNDQYGHLVGDEVLKHFATIVRANLRSSDIFGRWGGEEFMVVCPLLNLAEANRLAEKLRLAIEQAAFPHDIRITTSLGVTTYQPGEDENHLVERADQALYAAKEQGRNRVVALAQE